MVLYKRKSMSRRKIRRTGRKAKKVQNQVHNFRRSDILLDILSTTTNRNLAYSFSLSDLPNATEIKALYQQYKIKKIVLTFEPSYNQNALGFWLVTTSSQALPKKFVRVVHDYEDANALANEADYLQYANCRNFVHGQKFKVVLYPKVINYVENSGGAATGANPVPSPWLDTDTDTVPHFGIKAFIPDIGLPNNTSQYRLTSTVYFSCRNVQ